MSSTVGGGAATITRLATTVPRPVCTCTRWCFCTIRRTGARRATMSPSCLASRSGTRWEPPTNRRSWAPFAVSELRENVPLLVSSPEHATYQSVKRKRELARVGAEAGLGPAGDEVLDAGGVDRVGVDPLARASSSPTRAARGCAHGAATSISAAYAVDLLEQQRRRRRGSSGSGRDGARVLQPPDRRGDVDAVAGVVLEERRHAELARPARRCGPGSAR